MTTFHIFSIFPGAFKSYFETSILKRAQEKKLVKIKIYDIRDFTKDKHRTTDDRPFGGGPGMVMKTEPIARAIDSVFKRKTQKAKLKTKVILLSPSGRQFIQKMARDFAKKHKDIVLICGHYEGIDERVRKILKAEELSVGPYVLTGGELPAMVIIDAVSRHIDGVLGKRESLEEEKGSYPVYTRPEVFEYPPPRRGKKSKKYRVPKVLLSGDHKKIKEWRNKNSKLCRG
jgi:tRNA (guanine37-N1)-methyltransferase